MYNILYSIYIMYSSDLLIVLRGHGLLDPVHTVLRERENDGSVTSKQCFLGKAK